MVDDNNDWGKLPSGYDDKETLQDRLRFSDKNNYKNGFKPYRFRGSVYSYKEIWLPIFKDGKPIISPKTKKPVRIPKMVTNYDSVNHTDIDGKTCPYIEVADKMNKYLPDDEQLIPKQWFISNAINREAQDDKPEKFKKPTPQERETGFKDPESKTWTPYEAFPMTPSQMRKIKGLIDLNKVKLKNGEKKTFSINHTKYGRDISVIYRPKEKGPNMYDAQLGERATLTEEEKEYLVWDIKQAIADSIDKPKDAEREAQRLLTEFMKSIKKKAKDEDDEEGPEDLEDDEEETKSIKAKNKKKARKIEEDDDDLEDDDEKPKKKKKANITQIEDDDDEDEPKTKKKKAKDEDDDDDEKPRKKAKKIEEDEEDDDEKPRKKAKKIEEDEEDEEEKPKKKKKAKDEDDDEPKTKKKKAKDEDEEDEDDDDLNLDLDEDEEDEPKTTKTKKKKKKDDDEDDDDDTPF